MIDLMFFFLTYHGAIYEDKKYFMIIINENNSFE